MVAQRLRRRVRRALLRADRGLRRVRLSREPRRQLRPARLRLGLAEVPLPGRLRCRAPEQPADGLLRPGPDRPRRPRARRRGAAGRRQPQRLGLHAGAATAARAAGRVRLGLRQIKGLPRGGGRPDRRRPRQALPHARRAGGARACAARPWCGWPRPTPSARSGSTGARRCGRSRRTRTRPAACSSTPWRRHPPAPTCPRSRARTSPGSSCRRWRLGEHVVEDYATLRLSLKAHPLALLARLARPPSGAITAAPSSGTPTPAAGSPSAAWSWCASAPAAPRA